MSQNKLFFCAVCQFKHLFHYLYYLEKIAKGAVEKNFVFFSFFFIFSTHLAHWQMQFVLLFILSIIAILNSPGKVLYKRNYDSVYLFDLT